MPTRNSSKNKTTNTTESRAEISRRNGAKSKGPVSPQGKANSAKNSLKHGLLARTVVLPNESKDRFVRLHRALQNEFQPATAVERQLIETMTVARWRQLRLWGLEKSAIDFEVRQRVTEPEIAGEDDNTQTTLTLRDFTAQSRYLDHLSRFENRFDRQYGRALQRLLALRAAAQIRSQTE